MNLIYQEYPNRYVTVLTPGDTAWHFFTLPQPSSGAVVVVSSSNAAQTGPGATNWLYGGASAAAPVYGYSVPAGQALTSFENNGFWYKLTTTTDALNVLVAF